MRARSSGSAAAACVTQSGSPDTSETEFSNIRLSSALIAGASSTLICNAGDKSVRSARDGAGIATLHFAVDNHVYAFKRLDASCIHRNVGRCQAQSGEEAQNMRRLRRSEYGNATCRK